MAKIRNKKQLNDVLLELDAIESQIEDLQETADILRLRIKEYMGDRELVTTEDFQVRWTRVETNRFDTTLFKKTHPSIYDKYVFCHESRRFTYKSV